MADSQGQATAVSTAAEVPAMLTSKAVSVYPIDNSISQCLHHHVSNQQQFQPMFAPSCNVHHASRWTTQCQFKVHSLTANVAPTISNRWWGHCIITTLSNRGLLCHLSHTVVMFDHGWCPQVPLL